MGRQVLVSQGLRLWCKCFYIVSSFVQSQLAFHSVLWLATISSMLFSGIRSATGKVGGVIDGMSSIPDDCQICTTWESTLLLGGIDSEMRPPPPSLPLFKGIPPRANAVSPLSCRLYDTLDTLMGFEHRGTQGLSPHTPPPLSGLVSWLSNRSFPDLFDLVGG